MADTTGIGHLIKAAIAKEDTWGTLQDVSLTADTDYTSAALDVDDGSDHSVITATGGSTPFSVFAAGDRIRVTSSENSNEGSYVILTVTNTIITFTAVMAGTDNATDTTIVLTKEYNHLPIVSETISQKYEAVVDETQRGEAVQRPSEQGLEAVSGSMTLELDYDNIRDILEGMFGTETLVQVTSTTDYTTAAIDVEDGIGGSTITSTGGSAPFSVFSADDVVEVTSSENGNEGIYTIASVTETNTKITFTGIMVGSDNTDDEEIVISNIVKTYTPSDELEVSYSVVIDKKVKRYQCLGGKINSITLRSEVKENKLLADIDWSFQHIDIAATAIPPTTPTTSEKVKHHDLRLLVNTHESVLATTDTLPIQSFEIVRDNKLQTDLYHSSEDSVNGQMIVEQIRAALPETLFTLTCGRFNTRAELATIRNVGKTQTNIGISGSYTTCEVDVDDDSSGSTLEANAGTPFSAVEAGDIIEITSSESTNEGIYVVASATDTKITFTAGMSGSDNAHDETIILTIGHIPLQAQLTWDGTSNNEIIIQLPELYVLEQPPANVEGASPVVFLAKMTAALNVNNLTHMASATKDILLTHST